MVAVAAIVCAKSGGVSASVTKCCDFGAFVVRNLDARNKNKNHMRELLK